ncbi:MAG: alpha/beta hydrolase [SAR116 cluster bacterium]|jgi:lysophospholipase|nr:MAG: alpha/beta hydrolase [SAR116 cluster bacterium]
MKHEFWVKTNLGSIRTWKIGAPSAQHHVVIFTGLSEFCEKYLELISFLTNHDMEVLIFDWPGLGLSGAYGNPPTTSHTAGFDDLLQAGCDVIDKSGWADKRFFVIGHSMGGHLAFRLAGLTKYQIAGIMALSPMMLPQVTPSIPIFILASIISICGFKERIIPYTDQNTLLKTRKFNPQNPLSRNQKNIEKIIDLINENPSIARSGVSFGWLSSAFYSCFKTTMRSSFLKNIKLPVLILIGSGDKLVSINAIRNSVTYLSNSQLVSFNEAKHELYIEMPHIIEQTQNCIKGFINKNA